LHVTKRTGPDADGHLPLANVSDQLRRVVPDGREDLALAAAFEIGRLLALSQPSVVSALMRWRREQFGAERARQLGRVAVGKLAALKPALNASVAELGQLVGKQMVLEAAKAPDKVLAPDRPLVDPGRPLSYLTTGLDQVIANGFGFSLDAVRKNAQTLGITGALATVNVPRADSNRFDTAAAAHLQDGLASAVQSVTSNVVTRRLVPGTPTLSPTGLREARSVERDALDDLLEAAASKKNQG
jgi:hypothetical protein